MLFKLALKNIKKSFGDYAIYFLTLVLGVAMFYMFNSLDSQSAMMEVSANQRDIIQLMLSTLGIVSVFVAVVLGLLIVYANNFLINRRKKEFGIYMILGMGKWQVSKIILMETVCVGLISIVAGLILGISGSQFMSMLVAKIFDADMTAYKFVFSEVACLKTCLYFAIMYVAVICLSTFTVSHHKLINLLNAARKNEKTKLKNPLLCVVVFLVAAAVLIYAYWCVTVNAENIHTDKDIMQPIIMLIVCTLLIFWSLSGFILHFAKKMKKTYLKGTNMFVLRQISNKINTTVASMTVICLLLFLTICAFSCSLALKNTMEKELAEFTPVDLNLYKYNHSPNEELDSLSDKERQNIDKTVQTALKEGNFDFNLIKDTVEIPIYVFEELSLADFLGDDLVPNEYRESYEDSFESLIKVSDYNKLAKLYGIEQYKLADDEYIALCNYETLTNERNKVLGAKDGNPLTIAGKKYVSKYDKCQEGFVFMATSRTNAGLILVPDNCPLNDNNVYESFLAANYNALNDKEIEKIEAVFAEDSLNIFDTLAEKGLEIQGNTKIATVESSVGLTAIIIFIAIYLGITFLIAGAAILALKQLTEASDNRQRYSILRKIGCDEKMINKTLFRQIGIFFAMPLLLGAIHSIFGIQFGLIMLSGLASKSDLLPSIIATVIIIGIIYGAYFLATYLGSRGIIREDRN